MIPGEWHCLSCGQRGGEPSFRYLDGTYGSQPCHSDTCKGQTRVWHTKKEKPDVLSTELDTLRATDTPEEP